MVSAIEWFHCAGDRQEWRVTGTKCQLSEMMSGTSEIFILGAEMDMSSNLHLTFRTFKNDRQYIL